MNQSFVPELHEQITDHHLDVELGRILQEQKKLQRKFAKPKKIYEMKYADLILNRNSSQRTSQSSIISDKMVQAALLRGNKNERFKEIDKDRFSAVEIKKSLSRDSLHARGDLDDVIVRHN